MWMCRWDRSKGKKEQKCCGRLDWDILLLARTRFFFACVCLALLLGMVALTTGVQSN
jgi:hypothetical protein